MSNPDSLITKYQLFGETRQGSRLPYDLKNIIGKIIFDELQEIKSKYYTMIDFLKYIKYDQANNYPSGITPLIEGDNIEDSLLYMEKLEDLGWISLDVLNLNILGDIYTIKYTMENLAKLARLFGPAIEPIVRKLFVDHYDVMKEIINRFDYEYYITRNSDDVEFILSVLENNNMDDLALSFKNVFGIDQ